MGMSVTSHNLISSLMCFWPAVRVASHKATLVCLIYTLSFISAHEPHLQGAERLFVCLFLISDKGFCPIAVPYVFSTGQLSLDSDHSPGCSPQLRNPRSACLAMGFSHWQFPAYNLTSVIFFLRKDQNLFTAIEIIIVGNGTARL